MLFFFGKKKKIDRLFVCVCCLRYEKDNQTVDILGDLLLAPIRAHSSKCKRQTMAIVYRVLVLSLHTDNKMQKRVKM